MFSRIEHVEEGVVITWVSKFKVYVGRSVKIVAGPISNEKTCLLHF